MRVGWFAVLCLLLVPGLRAQEAYSRRNTYTVFAEYSNDSSHIFLGSTPNRKLTGMGVQYERRLLAGKYAALAYMAEFRPFIISSDPAAIDTTTGTYTFQGVTFPYYNQVTNEVYKCVPGSYSFGTNDPSGSFSSKLTDTTTCTRQNTLAQGGSPIGLRVSLRRNKRLQVMFSSNGGYMFSTKPMPIPTAGGFNFTFNFGGGLEYYTSARRSVRVEYLVQHYSNHYTAQDNPGVDSGFVRVGYAFGR